MQQLARQLVVYMWSRSQVGKTNIEKNQNISRHFSLRLSKTFLHTYDQKHYKEKC